MSESLTQQVDRYRDRLEDRGQAHLLRFWDALDAPGRAALLADLDRIDLDELGRLSRLVTAAESDGRLSTRDIQPPAVLSGAEAGDDILERGNDLLARGRVAALTVAGGQGTRLGFAGPKGAFPISPVRNKTLFQLFAETILATGRRCRRAIPWYIMTSRSNDQETRAFFESHRYFGLDPSNLMFFQQGLMPAFDSDGRILLDDKHRVALSPDGHGGCLLAMARQGVLADMARRGVEHISYFQVDNPLVKCLDPVFIGLHDRQGSDMSSKTLPKADDFERVGNFVTRDGTLTVIEYSDLPDDLARARGPDGTRRFDAANIAIHLLTRSFVERLTTEASGFALPWHRAVKKVPFVDLENGRRIEPAEPNAVKLESFVFDALPLAERAILVTTDRGEEFSPVKNADGVDSVATGRRDIVRRAARWLEAAGIDCGSRQAAGIEISPLCATDARDLAGKVIPAPPPDGEPWYVE